MEINNLRFWKDIEEIISTGFSQEGIDKLEIYGELFSKGKLLFKRFSPQEQFGCAAGGSTHVVATILAGTKTPSDCSLEGVSDFKRELQCAKIQEKYIEQWAKIIGVWFEDVEGFLTNQFGDFISEGGEARVFDNGPTLIKSIGLDYFIQPIHALDRISLHNTYFPETTLSVLGFGRDEKGNFKIIVEQAFVEGDKMQEKEIEHYALSLGFSLINKRNWTYATPLIYLSDLHDENVIKSPKGNIFVIDCDIRLNTPDLKCGGIRCFTNEVGKMDNP